MKIRNMIALGIVAASVAAGSSANAQYYKKQVEYLKLHDFQVGVGATGRYITPIANENALTPYATQGVGFLLNIREQPFSFLGLELNYSYNKFQEHYTFGIPGGLVPTTATGAVKPGEHELTLGYVAHLKTRYGVQPFVVVGAGAIDFIPRTGPNQWRTTGMYEVGFDFVPKSTPHLAFRIQQHALVYKAPDFYNDPIRSNTWVHQSAPSAGVAMRF